MQPMPEWMNVLIGLLVTYGFRVLGGLVILAGGWLAAGVAQRLAADLLARRHVDVTIVKFVAGIARLVVAAFALLIALGSFGIEITPLIAGLSVAGVGASLALQGTLSNYAAGTSLIFTKPFKVGDIIEVNGVMGEVEDVSLGRTQLARVDGVKIVVPNKHIIGEIIHNYSHLKAVDIKVGIGYGSDVDQAIAAVREVIRNERRVVQDKEPQIGIAEFADSSLTLTVRLWCKQQDYLGVLFGVNHGILREFRQRGIEVPFPQRDVHLRREGPA